MNAVQFSHSLAIFSQILCEICCIISIESQTTVANPIAHSLPHKFLVSVYGSQVNGRCTSMTEGIVGDGISICDGTSVLNDGIIPTLGEISSDPQSQWASQLFTMNRTITESGVDNITLSFQVGLERTNHDRMEIAVFNCPQKGIHTPVINVFLDTGFRPKGATITVFHTSVSLQITSCNHLLKFCVKFHGSVSNQYYSIQFPYQQGSNFVFLGEVTFINAPGEPCDPRTPEAITAPSILPMTGSTSQAAVWPDSTTQVDEATSPHLQDLNLVTTQEVINHYATTKESKLELPDQTSTQGTQETGKNDSTTIVLSIVFTFILILIIVLVVLLITVKLSRRTNCKHTSISDDDSACQSQVLLVDSDSLQQEEDVYTTTMNLDKVLDSDTNSELHLGKIADAMTEWEGSIAEHLQLSQANINDIKSKYPTRLDLQKRAALRKWKQYKGSNATYRNLIEVFKSTGNNQYANAVKKICAQMPSGSG